MYPHSPPQMTCECIVYVDNMYVCTVYTTKVLAFTYSEHAIGPRYMQTHYNKVQVTQAYGQSPPWCWAAWGTSWILVWTCPWIQESIHSRLEAGSSGHSYIKITVYSKTCPCSLYSKYVHTFVCSTHAYVLYIRTYVLQWTPLFWTPWDQQRRSFQWLRKYYDKEIVNHLVPVVCVLIRGVPVGTDCG